MVLSSIVLNLRGVQKFKMAAYKPEVLISQLVGEIETWFQVIIFGSGLQAVILRTPIMSSKMEDCRHTIELLCPKNGGLALEIVFLVYKLRYKYCYGILTRLYY